MNTYTKDLKVMLRNTHSARAGLLAAAVAAAFPAFAQTTPPGAGETLRELQQHVDPARSKALPSLLVPADADVKADPGQRFMVRSIRITGNVLIATSDLQPLVDSVTGHESSLGELRQAAARITALYRERGFVVARGFVPAQSIDDGIVQISVLEGSLNSSKVLNGSIVHTDRLEAVVAAQALEGKTIQSAETDRELLLLADLPAVGKVTGQLLPGRAVGTSDIVITALPGKKYEGDVSLDNYGNRYTGQNRLNGHVAVNSPLGLGDRLDLRGTATDEKLFYGRLAYDTPANSNGLRIGGAISSSNYQLGHEFAALDAQGTARTAGLYSSYPVLRGLNANVWVSGALDYRKLDDEIRSTQSDTRKSITAATLGAYGDLVDSFGGGAYSTWSLTGVAGDLHIDTPVAQVADEAGPKTAGSYQKLGISLTRLQAITPLTSAYVAISGQKSGKNLDSSERLVLGGIYGVRAYPQGEAVGDDGWLANFEVRRDLTAGLQASAFFDAGHVKFSHTQYAAGSASQTLKGYGVAMSGHYGDFTAKATVAWRDGPASVSAPDHSPRFWLTGGWIF